MITTSIYLLTTCCAIFFVSTFALQNCPSQDQLGNNEHVYTYGPCQVKIEQKAKQNSSGQSVSISLSYFSECEHKKPEIPGYVYLPGYCYYKYHNTSMTWFQGWEVCKNEGGHLAVFNSEEEAKFVGNILAKNSFDFWAFIGFHDLYQEGKHVTIFDETLLEAGWSKWEKSKQNGKTGENCGATFRSGELGDFVCYIPRTFFCEICYKTF